VKSSREKSGFDASGGPNKPVIGVGESFSAREEQIGAAEGVFEEHGDGHGTDAAGDRGDPGGFAFGGLEIDVADGFFCAIGRCDTVNADVDDDRAFADVLGGDQIGLANGDDEHLGALSVTLQIFGGDVAEGDGGHLLGEEQGDGLAGDFRCADDDGLRAAQGMAGGLDQLDDSAGGAGGDEGVAVNDVADVGGVDAFDILYGVNLVLELGWIEMLRDGKIEHNAGDGGIVVQFFDGSGDALEGGISREGDQLVVDSHSAAGFALALGVELAGGSGADEHGGEMNGAAGAQDLGDAILHILASAGSDCIAIDDDCGHWG